MKPLIAVDGWVTNDTKDQGKYQNEQGYGFTGFFRRDYKQTSDMVVMYHGYSNLRYKYPKIMDNPFHSPMIRWHNLFFCGGYPPITFANGELVDTNNHLLDAVRTGQKPIGFWLLKSDELEETICKAKQADLIWKITSIDYHHFKYKIGIANKGKVKDHFDLNKLLESYRLFSERLGFDLLNKEEEEIILNHNDLDLSYFINGYDYGSPCKKRYDHVLTGLLLGYPIESTVALIARQIY
jgi:hypothetical protein